MHSVFGDDLKHQVGKERVFDVAVHHSVNAFHSSHVPLYYLRPPLSPNEPTSNQGLDLNNLLQMKFRQSLSLEFFIGTRVVPAHL